MHYFPIVLCLCCSFYGASQRQPLSGVDSLGRIEWSIDVITTDDQDRMSNYERFEYDLDLSDRVVVFRGKEVTPFHILTNTVPASCMHWVKGNSLSFGQKMSSDTMPAVDSIYTVDQEKLNRYYLEHSDSLSIDTLRVSDSVDFSDRDMELDLLKRSLFYYEQQHNYEIGYYRVSELDGVYITDHFRLKYEGWWKFGEKHGKWKEYDKTGKLISVEKYRHDRLVSSRSVG